MQDADLSGVYNQDVMYRMAVEHSTLGHLQERFKEWTSDEMQAVHVRRLRGPWGRLYAKELAKLRQLLAMLDVPLPDLNAERMAVEKRESRMTLIEGLSMLAGALNRTLGGDYACTGLCDVKEQLHSLESALEHLLPSASPTIAPEPQPPAAAPASSTVESPTLPVRAPSFT